MGVEYEVKFRADQTSQDAIRQAVAGEEMIYHMQTTYYDTHTGALSGSSATMTLP